MGREDQKEERDVLDSIFPEEIQDISETEFRITITLDVIDENEEEPAQPQIILSVRYPEGYPDEAPGLDVTTPPNAPRHPHLDIQEDKARLLDAMKPTIEENMGMAMVFALYSTLKDSAELLISERQQAIQAEKDFESQKAEAEENRKFEGQKVTRESFLAWREKFRQAQDEEKARRVAEVEAEEKKKRGGKLEEKKLSGKQLWQQGLAGNVLDEDEEGEDAIEGVRELKLES
jgi:hypothetical protein